MEVYDAESRQYLPVDNRLNSQLRRSRFTVKGQPYENLSFNVTAALDLLGKDLLSATEAGANNGGSPQFRVWNAYVQWRLVPKREYLNLVIGYMPPQIGRESITSALKSTSMEKSWSQNYLRRHLTGIGPGRAMGLNLGGLISVPHTAVQWRYDIGLFNPVFEAYGGNSTGYRSAPLGVGRLVMQIGDPETKAYGISHKINHFGKRKGLSLAFAVAQQGHTDLFRSNGAIGGDWLLNFGPLNFDGEYLLLTRSSYVQDAAPSFTSRAHTGYLRISYNANMPAGLVLEPVATYWMFRGPMDAAEQSQALAVKSFAGEDESLDLGANLYFNPELKLSLHYTWRWGDTGAGEPGVQFNNYFNQSGLGAIRRGHWLGVGLVGTF